MLHNPIACTRIFMQSKSHERLQNRRLWHGVVRSSGQRRGCSRDRSSILFYREALSSWSRRCPICAGRCMCSVYPYCECLEARQICRGGWPLCKRECCSAARFEVRSRYLHASYAVQTRTFPSVGIVQQLRRVRPVTTGAASRIEQGFPRPQAVRPYAGSARSAVRRAESIVQDLRVGGFTPSGTPYRSLPQEQRSARLALLAMQSRHWSVRGQSTYDSEGC